MLKLGTLVKYRYNKNDEKANIRNTIGIIIKANVRPLKFKGNHIHRVYWIKQGFSDLRFEAELIDKVLS